VTIDDLLLREPSMWGLRGDPLLWREMRAALRGKPLPDNVPAADELFRKTFRKIVGVEAPRAGTSVDPDFIYLKKFSVGSGMSDGRVSLTWWRDTGLPIMLDRFAGATAEEDVSDRFGF
jgi:hypothetical protein